MRTVFREAPEDFKEIEERRLAKRRIATIKSSRRRTGGESPAATDNKQIKVQVNDLDLLPNTDKKVINRGKTEEKVNLISKISYYAYKLIYVIFNQQSILRLKLFSYP